MLIKGLYLYYGYKLSEREMIDIFFDADFRKDIEDTFKTQPQLIPEFDENNKTKCIDSSIRELVTLHYNKYFFFENGIKAKIKVCCNKCCLYDSDSSWVVGIKICHMPAFKNKISWINGRIITENDISELNKLNKKFNLQKLTPLFLSIPSDCWSCT